MCLEKIAREGVSKLPTGSLCFQEVVFTLTAITVQPLFLQKCNCSCDIVAVLAKNIEANGDKSY